MNLQWQLRAACGYAELGLTRFSDKELDSLDRESQDLPDVLRLRIHNQSKRKSWKAAAKTSRRLCRVDPNNPAGYLQLSFSLCQVGAFQKARQVLLSGPTILKEQPIYHYNLGCYEVQLKNFEKGIDHLKTSFQMDKSFRQIARKDPDLAEVWHEL